MAHVLEATDLRKRYGAVAALQGLDLTVDEGQVVGLLGPTGAGKTTALRILVGLVGADSGSVRIAGETVGKGWVAGERVGAMVATPVLYPHLSGSDNLRVLAAAWGWSSVRTDARIAESLRLVDLTAAGDRAAKGYSAARSIATTFLVVLLFFVADLTITGAPFWPSSSVPWMPGLTVAGSISRLLGASSQLVSVVPGWAAETALLAWIVLPIAGAIALFRRQDINE